MRGVTRAKGTGLGLAVVHQVAVAHGGQVRVEPAQGGGARFVVEIPQGVGVAPG